MTEHYIGSTLSQTIEFQDSNGDTIPRASQELVRVAIMVNNVIKVIFSSHADTEAGEEELTEEDDDKWSYTVTGEMQAEWTPGLLEVEVYRRLADDAGELTERFSVAMARATAVQSTLNA